MRTLAVVTLSALFACTTAHAAPSGDRITQAVYSADRLWFVTDDGKLSSLSESDAAPRPESPGGHVSGLCTAGGRITVVTSADKNAPWTVRQLGDTGWHTLATIKARDELLGLACEANRIVAVGHRQLAIVSGNKTQHIKLSAPLRGGIPTTFLGGQTLYVGFNAGEWGGGLHRIDLSNGRLETINALKTRDDVCGGPLDANCDPVTGITAMPGQPACVAVTTGLQHMSLMKGAILSVCGQKVETLYAQPIPPEQPDDVYFKWVVPFYGLQRQGDVLTAVAPDGLHRFDTRTRTAERQPLPELKPIGDVRLSFAVPGLIIVRTSVNDRHAVSGAAPLIVPR